MSGLSACVPCPAGTAKGAQTFSQVCTSCPLGRFSSDAASSNCLNCPVGKFSNATGMSSCISCSPGTYQMYSGSSFCEICSPGSFLDSFGQSICMPCGPGYFASDPGSIICSECPSGRYQGTSGSSSCTVCPAGRFGFQPASTECTPCSVGRFASNYGQSFCENCARGTYQPLSDQQLCLICPAGKFSFDESSACTQCAPRSVVPAPGFSSCIACPENSKTDDDQTVCICNAGFYSIDRVTTVDNTTFTTIECLECPLGANCDAPGVRWETLETREGWWRADRNSTTFYQCQLVDHCTGGFSASCGGNREGVLCNKCKPGYEVIASQCRKCGSASASIAVFVVLATMLVLIVIGMFYVVLKMDKNQLHDLKRRTMHEKFSMDMKELVDDEASMSRHIGEEPTIMGAPPPSPNFVYKLKIILGFFQISVALALTLDLPLPSLFKSFISFFNVANFDIVQWTRFGCVLPITFLEKHLVVAVFPVALILGIFLLYLFPKSLSYLIRKCYVRDLYSEANLRSSYQRSIQKFTKMVLFIIFLIYPTVSSIILKLFSCRTVEGVPYLSADFRIRCDSEEWKARAKLNILFTIMFPVAIPLFFAIILFYNRRRLHYPETLIKLGFLYAAYFDDVWWFEIVDVLHKLSLTSLLIFVPLDYKIATGLGIVLCYLILFLVVRPYIRKGDDRLHGIVLTEILLILLAGYVFRESGRIDHKMDIVLGVLFICITMGLVIFVVLQIGSVILKQIKISRKKSSDSNLRTQMDRKIRRIRADPNLRGVMFSKNPLASQTATVDTFVLKQGDSTNADVNDDSENHSSEHRGSTHSDRAPANVIQFKAPRPNDLSISEK